MKIQPVCELFPLLLASCVGWLEPTAFAAQPAYVRDYLQAIPTAWDETMVLAGEPRRLAIIARRSGETCYVGGINRTDNVVEEMLILDFLGKGKRHLSLIADSSDPTASGHTEINAGPTDRIPVKLSPRGGFAAKITVSTHAP